MSTHFILVTVCFWELSSGWSCIPFTNHMLRRCLPNGGMNWCGRLQDFSFPCELKECGTCSVGIVRGSTTIWSVAYCAFQQYKWVAQANLSYFFIHRIWTFLNNPSFYIHPSFFFEPCGLLDYSREQLGVNCIHGVRLNGKFPSLKNICELDALPFKLQAICLMVIITWSSIFHWHGMNQTKNLLDTRLVT